MDAIQLLFFSLSKCVCLQTRAQGWGEIAGCAPLFQFPLNNVIVEAQAFSLSENNLPVILYVYVLFEITKRSLKSHWMVQLKMSLHLWKMTLRLHTHSITNAQFCFIFFLFFFFWVDLFDS